MMDVKSNDMIDFYSYVNIPKYPNIYLTVTKLLFYEKKSINFVAQLCDLLIRMRYT